MRLLESYKSILVLLLFSIISICIYICLTIIYTQLHIAKGYEYGGDSHESHSSSKEMGLKDLFDIALTTLAFLSFGMFILQVLMCVTMVGR